MIVHTLNLSGASWNRNRQFTAWVHFSVKNFRQSLPPGYSRLPCFDDTRHIFIYPFGSQRTAVDKDNDCRNPRSSHSFHQFLLTSRQRKLVTVAVLSTRLLVFSYHQNRQIGAACLLHCFLYLIVR